LPIVPRGDDPLASQAGQVLFKLISKVFVCMRVVKEDSCENELSKGDLLAMLWEKFGDKTVEVMTEGSKLLALLWESAWKEGGGDKAFTDLEACEQSDLSAYYVKKTNLTSYRLTQIKTHLK
jgi:hypothetical protein